MFAVKDGKFVYVGDKAGVQAVIKRGEPEIIDYTGNGHAHYFIGHGIPKV